ENSLSAKVSCWLIRLLILGSGYNTMISHLGLIRTFLNTALRHIDANDFFIISPLMDWPDGFIPEREKVSAK
ncbi:hypothetical protein, partial [Klebsiella pneumoniae]|uniref:hypothetical protein n=1 Tax=Klebsiella pneumoniae TaxID=573 RepID=UPI00255427BC